MGKRYISPKIDQPDRFLLIGCWFLFGLVLLAMLSARIRLFGIPLERDEGEYAYAGQLLLEGIPPYKLAYNMKFPGTYLCYAVIMALFGQTPTGIHIGLLLVNCLTLGLIYSIGRYVLNPVSSVAAAGCYAVLTVGPSVLGYAGHATHFVNLFFLSALLLLLIPSERFSSLLIMASGALMGLAVLMKQPGLYLACFGGVYLCYKNFRAGMSWRFNLWQGFLYVMGLSVSLGLTVLLLWHSGVLAKFWFWTIDYARTYGGLNSFDTGLGHLLRSVPRVIGYGWLLWSFAAGGMTACFWNSRVKRERVFLVGLLAFSLLATSAGLYFREHYFILVLPAVSLFAGAAVSSLTMSFQRRWPLVTVTLLVAFGIGLAFPLIGERDFLFEESPDVALHRIAWDNPFPESIPIADYLRDHTPRDETIAVLGSEPQIYFYAHRHSATGYIYMYSLMENHADAVRMQREMIQEIEAARPKYIVFVAIAPSWLELKTSNHMILDWTNSYLRSYYTGVGLVNVYVDKPAEYYLPLEARPPHISPSHILIYERNS